MILGVLDTTQAARELQHNVRAAIDRTAPTRPPVTPTVWTRDPVVFGALPSRSSHPDIVPQLWVDPDRGLTAMVSGTLYNTADIKRQLGPDCPWRTASASEVMVRLYDRYSTRFLEHVNGKFAVALWDTRHQQLLLGRDRFGIEPLFYARKGGQLLFSSSLRTLLATGWIDPELDHGAILQYLLYCYNPGAQTLFQGVFKLPPGHLLRVDRGQIALHRYWYLSFAATQVKTEAQYREEIPALMEDAIRIRLKPLEAPGVFLSGGTDSSAIVSLTSGLQPNAVSTYSFRCEGLSYDESPYARFVAQHYGTKHTEVSYQPEHLELITQVTSRMDEPFCDLGIELATYLLGETAQGSVSYVFSGEGGDELFGGHPVYTADKVAHLIDYLPRALLNPITRSLQRLPDSDQKKNLQVKLKRFAYSLAFPPELLSHRWRTYYQPHELHALCTPAFLASCHVSTVFDEMTRYTQEADGRTLLSRSLYSDYYTLVDFYLRRLGLLQTFGIDSRLPLLDYRLVEYAAQIPAHLKLRGLSNTKYLYKKVLEPHVPRRILYDRPKLGHSVPMKNWLRDIPQTRQFLKDILTDTSFRSTGFFQADYIERLLTEHHLKSHNHSHRLWALVVLGLWLKTVEPH